MKQQNLFSLHGRIAFITGSSRGLGYEIAQGFGHAGATVIIHGRDQESNQAAVSNLLKQGISASCVNFDLNDRQACEHAFQQIKNNYGRLDILVNNASIRMRKKLEDLSIYDLEHIINTNLISTLAISKLAIQLMLPNKYGRIITITSLAGQLIRLGDFAYPITKQALNTMMKSIAIEYAKDGILSNAIAPGTFATEFNQELINNPDNINKMQARNPLLRWGNPSEIVGPALFLASEASSYVNGQVLTVDGGFSLSF